jgi:hypothetical protein
MHLLKWILLLMLLLSGPGSALAQDATPPPPLWDVLASIPDTPDARTAWSYVDYHALTGAATDQDSVIAALRQVASGPQLNDLMTQFEDQQRLTGASFFDVAQSATWGQPPGGVILLQGPFDPDAIDAAYSARGYTAETLGEFTRFCAADGCASGTQARLDQREPGDPFGGSLGRQQPVLLIPLADDRWQLLSAAPLDVVKSVAETRGGAVSSLADRPDYQAAARALTAEGVLLQAYFMGAEAIAPGDRGLTAENAPQTPDASDLLPAYDLAALADIESADGSLASVTLVFATVDEAETAAALLEARLSAYVSVRTRAPWLEMLAERGAIFSVTAAEDAESGLGLAQVTFSGPDDAALFYLLAQSLFARDLGWLAP